MIVLIKKALLGILWKAREKTEGHSKGAHLGKETGIPIISSQDEQVNGNWCWSSRRKLHFKLLRDPAHGDRHFLARTLTVARRRMC